MSDPGRTTGVNEAVIQLPEELTIALCGEYFQQLVSHIEQGREIALDGGAVERIDAAFVQLLCVVQNSLAEAGKRLNWTAVSPAIERSVELLGMRELLALTDGR